MNISCLFGSHKWDGCKCINCDKVRDEQHDWSSDCESCSKCGKNRSNIHKWSGCKCTTCNKVRDEKHDWSNDCELCSKCGKSGPDKHKWSGCKCIMCNQVSEELHDWSKDCETCSICGVTRFNAHKWIGCKCSDCNQIRQFHHDWSKDCEICSVCNKNRVNQHNWTVYCGTCSNCGKTRNVEHDWSKDCQKCSKCKETRSIQHEMKGCECLNCEIEQHSFDEFKCTKCGILIETPFSKSENLRSTKNENFRITKVKTALKAWYKECSKGQTGGGVCDDCMTDLIPGKTYLRPGGYLCCEKCTDTFLNAEYIEWDEALCNLNNYFGPGLPSKITSL